VIHKRLTVNTLVKRAWTGLAVGSNITVPNLTRSESTSIESTRGSEPDETRIDEYRPNKSRDLRTVTGFMDSYMTCKGIYIARSPSTLLAP
jgi:hypothetical protein